MLSTVSSENPQRAIARQTIVVVGRESVGKSQLISSLTRLAAGETNFRGSTVTVEQYRTAAAIYVDTPGILRQSDTDTTRRALEALQQGDTVLLVVQATQLDEDLAEMLPLVQSRRGVVAVTFWDKVQSGEAAIEAIEKLSADAGVAFIPMNARQVTDEIRTRLGTALSEPGVFRKSALSVRAGWRIEPKADWLEHRVLGPVLAIALLLLPALATIFGANRLADVLNPIVSAWINPLINSVNATWPEWTRVFLTAEQGQFGYGLLNMGPFLLIWALPTVLLFAIILGAYKASGLVERINVALHPLVRPLGLSGRDVVRVVMGFGCNVPAVISTRACSGCSRGPAISAIAFGAACSYQLPATLAVLSTAAAATGGSATLLSVGFLSYLLVTTLVYLRLTAPKVASSPLNVLMSSRRPFMQWPTPSALWRDAWGTLKQFFLQAMPIFVLICVVASVLGRLGVLDFCSSVLGPVATIFNLPPESALPVVLASVRKDGIILFAAENGLAFPLNSVQVLTGVYLAGVLFPCLVTALTIARETSWKSTGILLLRQALFAIGFTLILAWGGKLLL